MDSVTCAKSLRNPDPHINELRRRIDIQGGGGNSGFVQVVVTCIFPEGPTVVKFYFTNSKQKKTRFKFQTQ